MGEATPKNPWPFPILCPACKQHHDASDACPSSIEQPLPDEIRAQKDGDEAERAFNVRYPRKPR